MRSLYAALVAVMATIAAGAYAQTPTATPPARGEKQAPAAPRGGQPAARGAQPPARGGQQAERGGQPPTAERGQPPARGATAPPDGGYRYDPAGRRDPFRDLLTPSTETPLAAPRGVEGLGGLSVNDITVRGVLQSRGGFIAMVQAPDKKTYLVHQGDKFVDGTVRTVTPQGLVIVQEVRDPLSLVKQREIRKLLRSAEGTKP